MANTQRAPKQWCLTKTETVNSFENWRQNLIYTLSLDTNFTQFITTDANWGKKCASEPNRGFTNDDVIASGGRTALQQVYMLELMLSQIANYCRATRSSRIQLVYLASGKLFVCTTDFSLRAPIFLTLPTFSSRLMNVLKICISA